MASHSVGRWRAEREHKSHTSQDKAPCPAKRWAHITDGDHAQSVYLTDRNRERKTPTWGKNKSACALWTPWQAEAASFGYDMGAPSREGDDARHSLP